MEFFHVLITQPIYNVLIFFYNSTFLDFGVAIILTTLLLKTIFLPLSRKQIESQKRLQDIQPQMKALQQKYKHDKEAQARELMNLYKTTGANPLGGCLPLIIQIIFLVAIYRVLMHIGGDEFIVSAKELYPFIHNPGTINHFFLGIPFFDLTKPNILFAVLAAAAQYFQTKRMLAKRPTTLPTTTDPDKPDFMEIMNKQMLIIGPAMTLFIGFSFASALSLYWLISTLFMIGQQEYTLKQQQRVPQPSH